MEKPSGRHRKPARGWAHRVRRLFGAVLTAISVTGVIISAKRLARADAEARGAVRAAWVSMGPWAYIATASVILSLVLTPGAIGAGS